MRSTMVRASFGDPLRVSHNFAWVYRKERAILRLIVFGLRKGELSGYCAPRRRELIGRPTNFPVDKMFMALAFHFSTLSALGLWVVLLGAPISAQDGVLHEGTAIRVKLNRTISSATEHQGDRVDFEVLDDVKTGDFVVIPHSSLVLATVTEAVAKGRMGKGGKLNVNIDFVRLANGDKVPLRGVQENKGGDHIGAMSGGLVGTAIIFWPAAPLFLLMHGKDITIPQGHEVTVYTSSDYKAAGVTVVAVSASNPASAGLALNNLDIVKLKQAGFSDQLLITKIKTAPGNYQLDADDLMKLKNAGISDAVLTALMEGRH